MKECQYTITTLDIPDSISWLIMIFVRSRVPAFSEINGGDAHEEAQCARLDSPHSNHHRRSQLRARRSFQIRSHGGHSRSNVGRRIEGNSFEGNNAIEQV
jgi:hypothetical protein